MSERPTPEQRLGREKAEMERVGWPAYQARVAAQRKRERGLTVAEIRQLKAKS